MKPTKIEHNGATITGFMCGGVMSETQFFKDVEAHMMAFYLPDDIFKEYVEACADKRKFMQEYAHKLFKKHARSVIKFLQMTTRIDFTIGQWTCWRNIFGEWGAILSRKGEQPVIITRLATREELVARISEYQN